MLGLFSKNLNLNIAFVGNYLPRICGIATFTADLCETVSQSLSSRSNVYAVAINDNEKGYNYPPKVAFTINQSQQKDYFEAANFINTSNADIVCLQHEYGIYGGWDGVYILSLISSLAIPYVVTLHTILKNPNPNQKKILQELCRRASKVVVMSDRSIEFLKAIYGVDQEKIVKIYHGTPNFSAIDASHYKKRFKLSGREVLLTFGLLSPNKGIETVIKALPPVVAKFPNLTYVICGQTHPNIKREYGEKYRSELMRLVTKLKLQDYVIFDNRFVSKEELYAYLLAADIYISPYLNEAQIVSGTLTYAVGADNAVISTPYWYAQELLADGRGEFFDFNNSDQLSVLLLDLLSNKNKLRGMRKKAYAFGRQMYWEKVGEKYLEVFRATASVPQKTEVELAKSVPIMQFPPFDLTHLKRLTDMTGLIQHAKYIVPDRHTGYCLDDNARALMLSAWAVFLLNNKEARDLLSTYFSFTAYMQTPDGRFRNILDYQRRFTDAVGSDDAIGRAIWALGYVVWRPPRGAYRSFAIECFMKALPNVRGLNLRGKAFAILGLAAYLRSYPNDEMAFSLLRDCCQDLINKYKADSSEQWHWIEIILAYDNATIPLAFFHAYSIVKDEKYLKLGQEMLAFLEEITLSEGRLSVVGSNGWYPKGGVKAKFDQQPIDAAAMVLAFQSAYRMTRDKSYLRKMKLCFDWFLGENDMGMSLYDEETKGCADGLLPDGISLNQGGESMVSFLMAQLAMIEEEAGYGF